MSSSRSSNANNNSNNRTIVLVWKKSSPYLSHPPINAHTIMLPATHPNGPRFSLLFLCISRPASVSPPFSGRHIQTRGEFSFFIAQEASDEGILTTEDYSAVVWALLLSSIAAPVFFRRVLAKDNDDVNDAHSNHRRKKNGEEELAGGGSTTAVR